MLAIAAALLSSCSKEPKESLVPKTVDQDASLPSITVNGAKLHSEAFGHPDSTLVVCIHGGPGSDYRGMLNAKGLSSYGYRVVFYDQRGSGLSQRFSKRSYTDLGTGALDMMYNELDGVIAHYRTHSGQKVVLLGHSWGAIMATGYVAKHPDAVQKLILCEPGGFKWDDIMEYTNKTRDFGLWSEALNDATYIDQFLTGNEDQHEVLDYKMALRGSKNDITGEDHILPGSFWRSGAVINAGLFEVGKSIQPDFSEGIDRYNKPVLFIYSERNKVYTDSWAQKVAGIFRSARLIKINGVGHGGIISDNTAWNQQTAPQILNYIDAH
jgi:proline iminopeptidase